MKHSVPGGFTLIEILIVMFIMSIAASAALLSMRMNENKQIESFAKDLLQTITLAQEQAMLQPALLGFSINEDEVQFMELSSFGDKKKPLWVRLQDHVLGSHAIPINMQVGLKMNDLREEEEEETALDNDKEIAPQVVISTNGDVSPFSLYVGKKGQKPRFLITGDANGYIDSQPLQ